MDPVVMSPIFSDLIDLGCPFKQFLTFEHFREGEVGTGFASIVSWLTHELYQLHRIVDVAFPQLEDIVDQFLLQLYTVLLELRCRYVKHILTDQLISVKSKVSLVEFLILHVCAAKMRKSKFPMKIIEDTFIVPETEGAIALKRIAQSLQFGRPPDDITALQYFEHVDNRLMPILTSKPSAATDHLHISSLDEVEWLRLERGQGELAIDHRYRVAMMLSRLDVTLQSFCWSGNKLSRSNVIEKVKQMNLTYLRKVKTKMPASEVMIATTDLLRIEATSNANVRRKTISSLNRLVIGDVPDRGGRPEEHKPPVEEMPTWKERSTPSGPTSGQMNYNNRRQDNVGPTASAGASGYIAPAKMMHGAPTYNAPGYSAPVQMMHGAPASFIQPDGRVMPTYFPSQGRNVENFGIGLGGYGDTGGNFQQFGASRGWTSEGQQRGRGNRGQTRHHGRRGRGNY